MWESARETGWAERSAHPKGLMLAQLLGLRLAPPSAKTSVRWWSAVPSGRSSGLQMETRLELWLGLLWVTHLGSMLGLRLGKWRVVLLVAQWVLPLAHWW